ncbi:MAG: PKD domain-containing protein [Paludibacteraceae bacterium]|nr:PKD domain-containing protein [Paludibacteraceae bacterium]
MKRQSKIALLFALCVGIVVPQCLQAQQASTEGKEFWVALTLCAAPSTGLPEPFIAVSTKEKTKITITNPNNPTWSGIETTIQANQWEVFETGNGAYNIPLEMWYSTSADSIANAAAQAGKTNNLGLKVVADKDVSVFAALRMTNSFDAANILPLHVLENAQYEYYTQDYPPYIKPSDGEALSMFTILATENGTNVTITPACDTHDGKTANTPFPISLNAGQTYYVISKTLLSLSGSHVVADKPVAIFQGDVFTQIPGGKSARDCTFEQAMPVDYWGTQFVITRSKEKDANRVRITAMNDNTQIYLGPKENDNVLYTITNAGETFEIEMYKTQPTQQDLVHKPDVVLTEDAVFIESSCPVAVYSYDVSNGYKATPSEMSGGYGDPSMVWISPLEQRIKDITFGVCGTDKTDKHFIDIVCQTSDIANTTLSPAAVDPISFTPVPNNPLWSYARIHLTTVGTGSGNKVFTLTNPSGVIAHVYGNGNDESYAYSVGSAAVALGSINVGDQTFSNENNFSYEPFCANSELTFDASAGSITIDKVEWDFGDGTYETITSAQHTHTYSVPGWYDVTAKLYAHKDCPATTYPPFDVTFTFRVLPNINKDTAVVLCANEFPYTFDKALDKKTYTISDPTKDDVITDVVEGENCTTYYLTLYVYANAETTDYLGVRQDKAWIPADDHGHAGEWVYSSIKPTDPAVTRTFYRKGSGCDSVVTYLVDITKCLDFQMENDLVNPYTNCENDSGKIKIPYSYCRDGKYDANTAYFEYISGEKTLTLKVDLGEETDLGEAAGRINGFATIPANKWPVGQYQGMVYVTDANCTNPDGSQRVETSEMLDITVNYPDSIFKLKFGTTLAIYKSGYGGNVIPGKKTGYTFTAYQWYHDGVAIPGATNANYYSEAFDAEGKPLPLDGEYYVELTGTDGKVFKSCPQYIKEGKKTEAPETEDTLQSNPAPAKKVLQNHQIFILHDGHTYNIYGQKVE